LERDKILVSSCGVRCAFRINSPVQVLQRGNANATANQLNAFINEVQAQTGKSLDIADAGWLIELANAILMIGFN